MGVSEVGLDLLEEGLVGGRLLGFGFKFRFKFWLDSGLRERFCSFLGFLLVHLKI